MRRPISRETTSVPKRLGGLRPAARTPAANELAEVPKPSPLTTRASSWAMVAGVVSEATGVTDAGERPRPATREASAPFVSGLSGRKVEASRAIRPWATRSEEHTSELQSHVNLVCRLLLEKKKK